MSRGVHPLIDEQLISLMAKDNEAAFTALYHRYWEMMLGMAFNRLKDLPEKCRVVFRCSRQNGMSSREIADHLGISHKTVDNQLNKALYCMVPYSFSILRLAEMYLIAAEAENEVNGPANAYQYVNKIRWRARVNKSSTTDVPDLKNPGKDQFRDAVLMERKWELSNEGTAWFDLKRSNTFQRIQTVRGSSLSVPIGVYNQTWLIPTQEITNNNIKQNPQYQ
jgi:hypothetical protein